tara:strand:+ start:53 stop:613 length:561 start_codon:yes stop_codon:yes gene_type:complete
MPRSITAASKTAALAEHVRVIALASFDFGSGFVRVTSAPFDIVYSGDTYQGLGTFGKVSPVEEGAEQKAYRLQFELSGIPTALVSTALNEDYQGRDAKLWFALLDSSYDVIADPVLVFWGLMDTMDIRAGKEGKINIIAQSRLARWEEPVNHRMNNASQQALFADDKGLEFTEQMVEKEIIWPKAA